MHDRRQAGLPWHGLPTADHRCHGHDRRDHG
jgi:hypothetical protein